MTYIKKMVMHGFKSFGPKTEIDFDKGINVVLGPNGSGKSNVADALCFVLGRLSAKSMRASHTKNLMFLGSKYVRPAKEASVELIFDNKEKTFAVPASELKLARIVRRNGQGVYKINDETKTRAEVIEILMQGGIDPYGLNMVLQGEIQGIVKMHPEERRETIEDAAGISVYEVKKEKSLHELEKTEEKLKEINSILKMRFAHLKNLEDERAQALKFKDFELTLKRCKASLLTKKIDEKQKEVNNIIKSISEKIEQKEKKKIKIAEIEGEIEKITEKINQINKSVQRASGLEQESLRNSIAQLKADLEGDRVRRDNYENRMAQVKQRIEELEKSLPGMHEEIEKLKKKSPLMAQKSQELKKKKEELEIIGEERKRFLTLKTELNSIRELFRDKEKQLMRIISDSESTLHNLEEYSSGLLYKDEEDCRKAIKNLIKEREEKQGKIEDIAKLILEIEKGISVSKSEIERADGIKRKILEIDVCPLCLNKMTEEHLKHVTQDADSKIKESREIISESEGKLVNLNGERKSIFDSLRAFEQKKNSAEIELSKHIALADRKEYLKRLVSSEQEIRKELVALDTRRKSLELRSQDNSNVEERYSSKMLEIEEISSRTEEDVDTSILYKQREIERFSGLIKQGKKDFEEVKENIAELEGGIKNKKGMLEQKEKQEQELNAKFKKMFEERDSLTEMSQEKSFSMSDLNGELRQVEEQVNYLNIGKAKFDAELEGFKNDFSEYSGVELIQGSENYLNERLQKAQEGMQKIGGINLRALETYDEIKKEYDVVQEKVTVLDKEKTDIMSIIAEIDKKKKTTFMRTFREINEKFTNNFSKLYTKGTAYLEIENQEDIFAGGINIIVKLAKGKYFDINSLSGGEKTLVALALLFAIQEHRPYHFYVFDEIDAALDKRNSEKLAALLNQYMKAGQYIVISHNDAIIMNSKILYGVSMFEGVSKVKSINVDEALKRATEIEKQVEEERHKQTSALKVEQNEVKNINNEDVKIENEINPINNETDIINPSDELKI